MNDKSEYYVGLIFSYIVGIIMTPIYFLLIGVIRLSLCVCEIAWDAFLFTPRVVTEWQARCWAKQKQSKQNNTNLN